MAFEVQPIREFVVRPAIPSPLSRLEELAYNLFYSWEPAVRALFRRLDPALWRACNRNTVLMLGRVSQAALDRAATDPRYLLLYRQVCDRFDAYMQQPPAATDRLVAYFCMEYGIVECLPIYSGGLGILAGDFLKAASDSGEPVVGVGLLYQKGYLEQALNPDGWQQERYPVNDFYSLPIRPVTDEQGREIRVWVQLPAAPLAIRVWRAQVGRVNLYLLDTNVEENRLPEYRAITDQLYGGDNVTRIRQEIVLGIGGVRALRALGLEPTVFHMNEGHSAFLALERIRILMREHGLSFEEALEASRASNVFTTHTSVAAGIDLFEPRLMHEYFQEYCRDTGISFEQLMALGRWNPKDASEPFSMAVLAIRASSYRNAVSRLHRRVSQQMWAGLWPQLPVWEVPFTSITNGVHLRSWLNTDLASLYDQYLQPDWRDHYDDPKTWEMVDEIPDRELFEVHLRRKRRLIDFVHERLVASAVARKAPAAEIERAREALDPDAFTIGFARRFAAYKRATLLFRDIARLKRILSNPQMPVQIIIAGKAHPKDHPGKMMIREIVQLSRDPELAKRLVFVEDYGIQVARELVQGVDLWLNNPRRGEEACGTSGMKAGVNGVLNLSILDGWYDEAYEESGGWAIGDREPYSEDQDEVHARAIYSLLENEIVPMYYDRGKDGVPVEWMRRVKQSLKYISRQFDCRRMVAEYMSQLYGPAHAAYSEIRRDNFALVRRRAQWNAKVLKAWDKIRIVDPGPAPEGAVTSGMPIRLRVAVDLAGLRPDDVRVEAVLGRIGPSGKLESAEVVLLPPVEQRDSVFIFARDVQPQQTGRLGYTVRVAPNHFDDPLTRPCNPLLKWASDSGN
ncbi:MAG: alpha-glucan family phosphorylase [Bryobacterales bacterium]|nr:alpha-glucan family phosphorylase [Bryobacteraceae bacterium]MDW8354071.1 alpha-glucan family phosphorylase [Bryobacterales bacterium]